MRVTVVGAGIMGLSTAWALARDGATVTVHEQGPIPNPKGSSVDAHRLIRYAYGAKAGYARMVHEAYRDWESLWRFLGQRLYVPTGTLVVGASGDAPRVIDSAQSFDELGIGYETLTGEQAAARFPVMLPGEVGAALYTESGGVLLADRIVAALAARLPAAGVTIHADSPVRSVDPERGRVVLADGTAVDADCVVVTAGPWVGRLMPDYARRVTASRQIIAYLSAPADLRNAWRRCPMILESGARIGFYVVPPVLDTPVKVGDHGFTLVGDPDEERVLTPADARAMASRLQHRVRDLARYRLLGGRTCFYTVEPEERFIVDRVGKTIVATGFSGHGFKFGPTIGRGIADALSGRRTAEAVKSWAAGYGEQDVLLAG